MHKFFSDTLIPMRGHHIKVAEFRINPSEMTPPLTCDHLTIFFVGKVALPWPTPVFLLPYLVSHNKGVFCENIKRSLTS